MKRLLNIQLLFIILLISVSAGAALHNGQKYKDWVSRCETASNSQVCYIEQNLVTGTDNKQRLLGVQIGYYQKTAIGNFILPLGVLLKHGVKIVVDGFEFSQPVPFTYCDKGGCSASYHLDEKMIEMLKKGKKMVITAVGTNGKEFSLPVSLNGFTQAFGALTSE
ncbi:MAG: invasion associated locus B family protein [Gammaproteobacteria bacterium]|nr:invasion associated locus B family protein [Gammaproteobacteria bacterium]